MKKLLIYLSGVIVVVLLTMFLPDAKAKEIDISITAGIAYDRATRGSGMYQSPTGTHRENWVGFNPSAQVKYNQWKLQPTFEFNFRREYFNFSNWEQHSHTRPTVYSFLAGVTYDFKPLSVYILTGVSRFQTKAALVELLDYPFKNHGSTDISANLLTFKVGGYRLWDIDAPVIGKLKVGPEIGLMIYPKTKIIERCRNLSISILNPSIGIRGQW